MASADQSLLQKRATSLTAAFNAHSVPQIMSHFHPDITYSDYAWNALDMSHATLISFYTAMYANTSSMVITTEGMTGTREFTAWEWTIRLVSVIRRETHGMQEGERVVMLGVSLQWWREEEGVEWKICKWGDYAVVAPGKEREGGEGEL